MYGGEEVQIRLSFFSLFYDMPAPSAECHHLEAWPTSTYGHLRGVSLKIVPPNKVLFAGTVPEIGEIFLTLPPIFVAGMVKKSFFQSTLLMFKVLSLT